MIKESNLTCPHCGNITKLKIPEDQWLTWYTCRDCNTAVWGKENAHGWTWVFCSYGDAPWFHIQESENKK